MYVFDVCTRKSYGIIMYWTLRSYFCIFHYLLVCIGENSQSSYLWIRKEKRNTCTAVQWDNLVFFYITFLRSRIFPSDGRSVIVTESDILSLEKSFHCKNHFLVTTETFPRRQIIIWVTKEQEVSVIFREYGGWSRFS